jgi:hypothetical protein
MTTISVADADALLTKTWLQSHQPGRERAGYRLVCAARATHRLDGDTCPQCHTSLQSRTMSQRDLLPSGEVGLALTRLPSDLYQDAITALSRGEAIRVERVPQDAHFVSTLIVGKRAGQATTGRAAWGTWDGERLSLDQGGISLGLDGATLR